MHPHAFFIACSYGALAVAIVWELWSLRRLRAASLRRVRDESALDEDRPGDDLARTSGDVGRPTAASAARSPGIRS